MKILYPKGEHVGWSSVTAMTELLAETFEAELEVIRGGRDFSQRQVQLRRLPRRRGRRGDLLLICSTPADLNYVLRFDHFVRGYERVSAWVIDSFRIETIPDVARALGHFDHLFVGDAEVADLWATVTRTPVTWIPFGAEALRASPHHERPIDVQRVGRQPASWDDDDDNTSRMKEAGLTYAGRTPFGNGHLENHRLLRDSMGRTKFTLAFSNTAAPSADTHPTYEYLTGRWLDALAVGATVMGIAPRCRASDRLLWPEATIELGTTDREESIDVISDAVRTWTPERVMINHLHALERIDWRWRFAEVAEALGLTFARLDAELDLLRTRIHELSG